MCQGNGKVTAAHPFVLFDKIYCNAEKQLRKEQD